MLTWPVASLGWVISIIQRAAASQQRLNEFLKEEPGIVSGDLPCNHIDGNLEFRNVSVKYDADRNFALENVSFKINAGESVGVIGRTGSGKSTLVNVLLRLVDPVNGEVLIDGKSLKSLHLDDYRKQIGCVPQDVFLFSDTIKENIAFGLEGKVEDKAVEEAARAAVVYDNIVQFPLKFDTMVGERGITLSGGQKQRVSIARAIIRNPDVLIFDDCLSAVDTITEEKILSNLTNIMKGKTSVLVSHRVATVKACNRILVLEEGRLAEEGTHESLLARNGLYRQLFELQLKENKSAMANGVVVEK
jgi:ATP-binding cassette subfamily B protein